MRSEVVHWFNEVVINGLCGTMWNSKKTMGHQHQPAALRMTEGYGHRSAEVSIGMQEVDKLLTHC